jgi:hypothetical protein
MRTHPLGLLRILHEKYILDLARMSKSGIIFDKPMVATILR